MVWPGRVVVLLTGIVLLPAAVFGQASLTGTVKDASGAVLPGVTVEAASPALIEKVRSVVTDRNGGYRIVDLRPGPYSVTFALPGFNTLKRDGIQLTGSVTVVIDTELKVGAVEETITVTGETPVVDLQSTTKQRVINADLISTIPSGRSFATLGVLIPSINSSNNDVGGSQGDPQSSVSAHGGRANDQRILQNGLPINDLQTAGAGQSGAVPNVGAAAEVSLDFGGLSAEQTSGGVSINFIPRDGGNTFRSSSYFAFANEHMASSNLTQRLKDSGLKSVDSIAKNWDFNPGFGGPLKRDTVWFYFTGRYIGAKNYAAGIFPNKNAFRPDVWTYEPDTSRKTYSLVTDLEDAQVRLTYQANAKHKFSGTLANNTHCRCPFQISSTVSPEAANDRRFPNQRTLIAEWRSTLTSRVLVEAIGFHKTLRWGTMHLRPHAEGGSLDEEVFAGITPAQIALYPTLVGVTEQGVIPGIGAGLNYHGPGTAGNGVLGAFNSTWVPNYTYRAAVSYVTAAHNAKFGVQDSFGYLRPTTYAFIPYRYQFLNGVPNLITQFATPWTQKSDQHHDLGIFAQDKWTIARMTFTGGLRFDYFNSSYPAQTLGPATLVRTRNFSFPAEPNLDWKDFSYRSGWAYDVQGNGKTAVRVSFNKYLAGQALGGLGSNTNPIGRLTNVTSRSWTDANKNFFPDCDLTKTGSQDLRATGGDFCGAMQNPNFGTPIAGEVRDAELRSGWGKRGFNYEFTTVVQRELLPRVSVDVGYFRRWYGNFAATDDLNLSPADLDEFSIVVPVDPRLPNDGGYTISGLHDRKLSAFGRPTNQKSILVKSIPGNPKQIERWHGVDVNLLARLSNGLLLQGGFSTGKTTIDNCEVLAALPEMTLGAGRAVASTSKEFCHVETPFLGQAKALGSYTIPRVGVQVAATFQSIPGIPQTAALIVSSAEAARSLGRPLSGNLPNVTVNMIPAMGLTNNSPTIAIGAVNPQNSTVYGERINQIDFRVGKILRFGQRRATLNLDVYNVTNRDTVTGTNKNYASLWLPTSILQARFVKFSAQLEF